MNQPALLSLTDAEVVVYDHPEDKPADRLLCGQVGRILSETYPGWHWYVDIPPNQNILIVRNLTCDPRGTMGMVVHKNKMDANVRADTIRAGGEFLERYRMRRGRIDRDSLAERGEMLFQSPET